MAYKKDKFKDNKNENFIDKVFKRENFGGAGVLYSFLMLAIWFGSIIIAFAMDGPITGRVFSDFLLAYCCSPIYIIVFLVFLATGKFK